MIELRWDKTSFLKSDLPHHQPVHPCGFAGGLWDSSLWTGLGHWEGWRFDPPLHVILWRRWTWALKRWASSRKFRCRVCGIQCDSSPIDSGFWRSTAVCPEHCAEHDYKYDRDLRCRCCIHCGDPLEIPF